MSTVFYSRLALAMLTVSLLAACGAGDPYFIGRQPRAGVAGYDRAGPPRVDPVTKQPYFSVCYNKLTQDAAEVRRLVRDNCTDPRLVENRQDLETCSLAAPVRATYLCSALSTVADEAMPNLQRSDAFVGTISLY